MVAAGRANHAGDGAQQVLDEVRRGVAPADTALRRGLRDALVGNARFYGSRMRTSAYPGRPGRPCRSRRMVRAPPRSAGAMAGPPIGSSPTPSGQAEDRSDRDRHEHVPRIRRGAAGGRSLMRPRWHDGDGTGGLRRGLARREASRRPVLRRPRRPAGARPVAAARGSGLAACAPDGARHHRCPGSTPRRCRTGCQRHAERGQHRPRVSLGRLRAAAATGAAAATAATTHPA